MFVPKWLLGCLANRPSHSRLEFKFVLLLLVLHFLGTVGSGFSISSIDSWTLDGSCVLLVVSAVEKKTIAKYLEIQL